MTRERIKMRKLIVSRHPAAIAFVRETLGWTKVPCIPGASDQDVTGADVVGNLPLHLATLCGRYRAIELPEIGRDSNLRGVELTPEQMRASGARIVEYAVIDVENECRLYCVVPTCTEKRDFVIVEGEVFCLAHRPDRLGYDPRSYHCMTCANHLGELCK